MTHFRAPLILLYLLFAIAGCGEDGAGQDLYTLGDFRVAVTGETIRVERADGTVLLDGAGAGSTDAARRLPGIVGWRKATDEVINIFGMFVFKEQNPTPFNSAATATVISSSPTKLTVRAGAATGTYEVVSQGVLRVSWNLDSSAAAANRFIQSFSCKAGDHFFGLGARVHGTDHRGEVIPAWTSEQGIGKVRRGTPMQGFPIQGDIHDAYLPVPFVMSQQGFGVLVENSQRSLFHLCPQEAPDRWALELQSPKLQYLLIDGPAPVTVLQRLTAITGRPRLPPKWAFAPWIDIIHGQQKVLDGAKVLRQNKVPSSAIWTEDWVGGEGKIGGYHLKYQWTADTTLYPDLKTTASTLHHQGFRFLGYFNPFLEEGYQPYKDALQKDYAVKDASSKVITFQGVFFKNTALPDLTKKVVTDWIKGHLKAALDLGFDGWMADYAEWLPLDARLSNGMKGEEAHNLYPLWWQRLHRELLDSVRKDGDYVFFPRSGWAGSGGLAPVVWAGDQQTEFGGYDGMASVIPLCVNLGMSGVPIVTHDIGGYSTVNVPARTRELFYRWTELGAFSPVMRTHHGASEDKNWQWDKDAATIAFFGKYAGYHVALFPYRYTLAQEAVDNGRPMMRHMALHFPADPRAVSIKDQYLLGPGLLVAPVQQDKATSRKVYLPGALPWWHYFSGKRYEGGKEHTVTAGLEQIPVFAAAGALIPVFLTQVDTLDRAQDKAVTDIDDAEDGPLGIKVFLGRDGALSMYDGLKVALDHVQSPASAPTLLVDGKSLPTCTVKGMKNCVEVGGSGATAVRLGAVKGFEISAGPKSAPLFALKASGAPKARDFVITFYW